MSNQKSLEGISEILSKLEDDTLFSLAATVSQGFLRHKIASRNDAVKAILTYSPDTVSILKRKLVTRDLLFDYLHEKRVPIKLPATKVTLIGEICKYWDLYVEQDKLEPDDYSQQLNKPVASSVQETNVDVLAEKFTEWFYAQMNQNECIPTEHFWPDAKLILNFISDMNKMTERCENSPVEIANLLYKTKCQHSLFFNPNLTKDGVKGKIDSHGLVAVLVCGTLHTNNTCVGVFEQIFALARDPFADNNWKIKNSELNLRNKSDVESVPKLCDTELNAYNNS